MRCPTCHRRLAPHLACPIHAQQGALSPVSEPLPIPVIDGFRGLSFLGRGGFADVFIGERVSDGLRVALKVGRDAPPERFIREAEALRQVGSPWVAELFSTGMTQER